MMIDTSIYSDDLQRFANIAGQEKTRLFMKKQGALQLTFSMNKTKDMDVVREYFGDKVFKMLCKEFVGFGRIKLPACSRLNKQAETLEVIAQGLTSTQAAKKLKITERAYHFRIKRLREK